LGITFYRVVPNEVPILFALGLISFHLRNGSWTAMGLCWPSSWRRTVLIALAAAALGILLGALVIDPITAHLWPPQHLPSGADQIAGHGMVALRWLLLIWTFAAFGEEIGYRGYLVNRAGDVGGRSKAAYCLGVLIVSVLFGYGHYYKGPAGVIDSGLAGLDSRRDLRAVRTQPLGLHFGPRIYRHVWSSLSVLRMVFVKSAPQDRIEVVFEDACRTPPRASRGGVRARALLLRRMQHAERIAAI
jgi:membrane protease YdiL (CAAX protease family)